MSQSETKIYRRAQAPARRSVIGKMTLSSGDTTTSVSWVPDGVVVGDLYITVDWDSIAYNLGRKALLSKSKRATGLKGMVKVKAVNVRKEG